MKFPTLLVAAVLFVVTGPVLAQHHGGGHGHGGVRFGLFFGVPAYPYYPHYYYPPTYYYPPRFVVLPPPAYVEQSPAPQASAPTVSQGDWYYCAESRSYYPYVRECPTGWERVPAQPPR